MGIFMSLLFIVLIVMCNCKGLFVLKVVLVLVIKVFSVKIVVCVVC